MSQKSSPVKQGFNDQSNSKALGTGTSSPLRRFPQYDPALDEMKMRMRQAEFEMTRLLMLASLEKEREKLDSLLAAKARSFWAELMFYFVNRAKVLTYNRCSFELRLTKS